MDLSSQLSSDSYSFQRDPPGKAWESRSVNEGMHGTQGSTDSMAGRILSNDGSDTHHDLSDQTLPK